ncbi:hypothetical protein [Sulfurihydrogenibium sp.]|jgi:hypothetical protein|uniref:hypothetical protein n=1 Tax=Sulfurihydrogenibium sp. TaxID=2053621 RepID=UPI002637A0ED|nr:hypothetical protein [Sulfurihydrogenibium sp.]
MENLMSPYIEGLGIIKSSSDKKKKQNLEKNIFDDIIAKSVDKKEAVKKNRNIKNKDKDFEAVPSLNIALSYNAVNNIAENLKNIKSEKNKIKDFKLAQESLEIRQQKMESIIKFNQLQDKTSLQMDNIKQDIKRENLNVIEEENLQNLKIALKKLNKMNNLVDNKNKSSDVNDKLQKDVISNLLKKKEEFEKLTSKIEDKKSGELKEFNILKSNKEPELEISINNFNENLRAEGLQNSNEVNIYTNKNNDGNNTAATNYNDILPQSLNINISNPNDNNSSYQNNQNDNNFNKNMNGQNQNNNSFVFSYNQTNISAHLASNALNLVINTKDVILDDITILQIQQILKDSGFKHHNITIKDKEKVLKLYEYKAINNSNTSGINLAV